MCVLSGLYVRGERCEGVGRTMSAAAAAEQVDGLKSGAAD